MFSVRDRPWGAQRPVPGSSVLWGHPLADRLHLCALFNDMVGPVVRESAHHRVGILNGGAVWAQGFPGPIVDLNGTNAYIRFVRPQQISAGVPWTISMIAKFDGTPDLKNLFNLNDGTNNIAICYWWNSGNGLIMKQGTAGDTSQSTELSADRTITRWHHYHMTWDGAAARAKIYVDGTDLSANGSAGLSPENVNTFDLSLGIGAGFHSDMSITSAWLWSRELRPAEVQAHVAEPYAMIAPAAPRLRYFVQGAAAPSGWGGLLSRTRNRLVQAA